ncbi:MAG: glycosyltransferase family 39 protein [Kofleriaceae bacterium]
MSWRPPPWLAGVALALAAFVAVVSTQGEVGINRDETVYMHHGSRYAGWWIDLVSGDADASDAAITKVWGGRESTANNREHPPLVKTLMGLSERLFHDQLGWTDEVTGYRLPQAALAALLVWLVFLMAWRVWGLAEGVLAAALVMLMPRPYFHASIGCFDGPIASLWFATIYAYWRALASRRWQWGVGVVFGLALATKHNALLLPGVLGLHYLWLAYRSEHVASTGPWARRLGQALRSTGRGIVRRRPWVIASLAVLGPLTLYALWPWLWHAPVSRLGDWLGFHLAHVHYNFEYLGDNLNTPPFPWHVAVVTTLVTAPVVTLVGAALGTGVLIVRARRGQATDAERAPGLLLALSVALSMGPFFLGSTPIFGAEKHWQPAMASVAIAAAVGLVWAARAAATALAALRPRSPTWLPQACAVVVGGLAVTAAAVETGAAQPYALTHYNALAGGAPGGADLGMNRQFWGYAARGVLPYLRAHAPADGAPAAPVYTHDAQPAWGYYLRGAQRGATLPRSLPDSGSEWSRGIEKSTWALVVHERHFARHDYLIWQAYGTVAPAYVFRVDGVPVVSVYRRPSP